MDGLFFEKHLVVKIDFAMSFAIYGHVVKNYVSTSVKRGVGGVQVRPSVTVSTHPTNSFGPTTPPSPPSIKSKKNPTTEQDPNRPDQTPVKNGMSTPSNKEGGTDHKKDSKKARS